MTADEQKAQLLAAKGPQSREDLLRAVCHNMSPSEAAALAVLAAHVRSNMDEARMRVTSTPSPSDEDQAAYDFLLLMEERAVGAIQVNDGNVVTWIGHAAKQMNPLLS